MDRKDEFDEITRNMGVKSDICPVHLDVELPVQADEIVALNGQRNCYDVRVLGVHFISPGIVSPRSWDWRNQQWCIRKQIAQTRQYVDVHLGSDIALSFEQHCLRHGTAQKPPLHKPKKKTGPS